MTTFRHRGRSVIATFALMAALAGCATGGQPAAAPPSADPAEAVETVELLPSGFPTDTPTSDPTDDVFADGGERTTYERTWPLDAWPMVPVPAAPLPRLTVTCPQLSESAGLATSLRSATVQPTLGSLSLRQIGATLCSYTQTRPEGASTLTVAVSLDDGATGRDMPATCSYTTPTSVATTCRGRVDVGAGSAEVILDLPPAGDPALGRQTAQSMLDAARRTLENPGTTRPVPAVPSSAMGVGEG